MNKYVNALLTAALVLLAGCATSTPEVTRTDADKQALLELNERLVRTQLLDRDKAFLSQVAIEDFRVLAPGGLVETKPEVIRGLVAWNVKDVTLSGTEVVFFRDMATVIGRMDIDGTMAPVGRWGPLKYMSTWVEVDGQWRLVSRSLTPCLDMLIKLGRC